MTVKDLIITYGDEEIGIKIHSSEDDKFLIPHIWKTDYTMINPRGGEYVCKNFHMYDNTEIDYWTIENNEIHIYIDET